MFTLSLNTIVKNQHPEDKVLINAAKILTRDLQEQLTGRGNANVIRLEKGSFADLNQE